MRYFVIATGSRSDTAPHIIAEVVRDSPAVEDDLETTLASALAGERAVIATRAELLAHPSGRDALEAWYARDDDEYDHETAGLQDTEDSGPPRLRLVADDERRRA